MYIPVPTFLIVATFPVSGEVYDTASKNGGTIR